MNIHSGINLKLPDGRRGHYIRAKIVDKEGRLHTKYFSVKKYGQEKALKLAKVWLDSKKGKK